MRIAFLSVSGAFGGSERALWQLVRGIRRLAPSTECAVVVPRDAALAARMREAGAVVHVLPMPDALASFGEWSLRGVPAVAKRSAALLAAVSAARPYQRVLHSLLVEINPDVVHTNGFKLHVLGSRAAPRGAAVVWHLHEFVFNRPLSSRMLRHHVPRAGAIVANSLSVARDARAALGSAAPVEHVYNAVDLAEFSPSGPVVDLDALAGLPPPPAGTTRVGLVATFARWKGHETFLRALRDMSAPVRGYIVGGSVYDTAGSQYTVGELRSLAASIGVERRVAFTGFVEDPASVMRALDVVVHASTDPEPFGLVIAEGLACGRPVVLSAGGGAAELVEDGRDAMTLVPGDAPALARALERLANDESLRARLGNAARSTAIRRFDPDTYARAFLEVYQRVASRPRTAVT